MIKDGAPDDDDLENLAKRLGRCWDDLARRLKFTKAEISGFDDENRMLAKKASSMLRKWKEKYGLGATFRVLYDALCHHLVNRKDLAEAFCCADSV